MAEDLKVEKEILNESQVKVQAKLEEMKKKRANQTKKLDIVVSDDRQLNVKHAIDEIMQVLQEHKLAPLDIGMISTHMNWVAIDHAINNGLMKFSQQLNEHAQKNMSQKGETFEEKREAQFLRETKDGKVRVPPTQPIREKVGSDDGL